MKELRLFAEKLNRLLRSGLKPEQVRVGNLDGRTVILAGDEVLIVVDDMLAKTAGASADSLALQWVQRLQVELKQK